MAELTVAEMEQAVRAAWDKVWDGKYSVHIYIIHPPNEFKFTGLNERWKKAYAFTQQRLADIRQLQYDIEVCATFFPGEGWYDPLETASACRTLARLQAIKAELQRGMSAQTKEGE